MFLARWNGDVEYQFQASEAVRFSEAGRWITTAPPQGALTGLAPVPSLPADPWPADWLADCLFDSLAYSPGGSVIKLAVWFACWLIHSLTDSAAERAMAGLVADWLVKYNWMSLPCSLTEGKCENTVWCAMSELQNDHPPHLKGSQQQFCVFQSTLLRPFSKAYSHNWDEGHAANSGLTRGPTIGWFILFPSSNTNMFPFFVCLSFVIIRFVAVSTENYSYGMLLSTFIQVLRTSEVLLHAFYLHPYLTALVSSFCSS